MTQVPVSFNPASSSIRPAQAVSGLLGSCISGLSHFFLFDLLASLNSLCFKHSLIEHLQVTDTQMTLRILLHLNLLKFYEVDCTHFIYGKTEPQRDESI